MQAPDQQELDGVVHLSQLGDVELRGRWWNGRFGRLARRDIWLLTNGTAWRVEARAGDGDAGKWQHDYADEERARSVVAAMMERTGGRGAWRDLQGSQSSHQAPP
jgi:hypothetical protein